MSCQPCLKINPIPQCLEVDEVFEIGNITLTEADGLTIILKLTDLATGGIQYFSFVEGDAIDITDAFPLMNHFYMMEFFSEGVPVEFTITNPDATQVIGCCIEFTTQPQLTWDGGEYAVSTINCVTA